MLAVVKKFQKQYDTVKPIIVADAAMLSQANRDMLEKDGYQYIVGARLSNTKFSFLQTIFDKLPKQDDATIRIPYPNADYEVVCAYSHARYKKDKREMDKQIEKAEIIIRANLMKKKYIEVPIDYKLRVGESTLQKWRSGKAYLRCLFYWKFGWFGEGEL